MNLLKLGFLVGMMSTFAGAVPPVEDQYVALRLKLVYGMSEEDMIGLCETCPGLSKNIQAIRGGACGTHQYTDVWPIITEMRRVHQAAEQLANRKAESKEEAH